MKNHAGYTNNKGVCFRYGISRTTLYCRIKKRSLSCAYQVKAIGGAIKHRTITTKKAEAGKPVVEVKNEVSTNHSN